MDLFELKVKGVSVDIERVESSLRDPRQNGEIWRIDTERQTKTLHRVVRGTEPFPPITLSNQARHNG